MFSWPLRSESLLIARSSAKGNDDYLPLSARGLGPQERAGAHQRGAQRPHRPVCPQKVPPAAAEPGWRRPLRSPRPCTARCGSSPPQRRSVRQHMSCRCRSRSPANLYNRGLLFHPITRACLPVCPLLNTQTVEPLPAPCHLRPNALLEASDRQRTPPAPCLFALRERSRSRAGSGRPADSDRVPAHAHIPESIADTHAGLHIDCRVAHARRGKCHPWRWTSSATPPPSSGLGRSVPAAFPFQRLIA